MQSVWDEIKSKLNLVEVIEDYVDVKQIGGTYKCVCPFHPDKNPSLVISPERGFWHCFGCGAGGDCFKFVMDFENISKKETLEKLAKKAGVGLENSKFEPKKEVSKVQLNLIDAGYKYLELAAKIYHQVLLKVLENRTHPVTLYCLERKLNSDAIATFQIGYAPNSDLILQTAKANNLDLNLLEKIGVLKFKNDQFFDKYKDRLMFPIKNIEGKLVGFTGRNLPYDKTDRPKYLNSPQTEWFNKSDILYGYSLNQKQIRSQKQIIFVEGNMDVVSSYIHGIKNVVASQGTSFTPNQLTKVSYLTRNLAIAFDNDSAGLVASRKLFLEASRQKFAVYKVIIPEKYKDLDEYLNHEHLDFDQKFDLQTQFYLDFALNELRPKLQSETFLTQKQAVEDFLELLVYASDITVEHYVKLIHKISSVSLATLQKTFNQLNSKSKLTIQNIEETKDFKQYKYQNTPLNKARVNFQNLLAKTLEKHNFEFANLPESEQLLLINIFTLFQKSIDNFSDFKNLDNYIAESLEDLQFTASNVDAIPKEKLLPAIIQFLDENLDSFKNDDTLLNNYLSLKRV